MSSSDDEYGLGPEFYLPASILNQIDSLDPSIPSGSIACSSFRPSHPAHIDIKLEEPELQKEEEVEDSMAKIPVESLYSLFRSRRGHLSITDLTGPSWCEVQYDYNLRSGGRLPVALRPLTFQSAAGTIIEPDIAKAVQRETIMKKGTRIHEALEREIHPEEVKVRVNTQEETWALRMINMLCCMSVLIENGKCREIPVMGFIEGQFVVGVIDEIERRQIPKPASSSSDFSSKVSPSKGLGKITSFFQPIPSPTKEPAAPTHTVHISDSKTRQTKSLPAEKASDPGKLQVMAYKLLFDSLLLSHRAHENNSFSAVGNASTSSLSKSTTSSTTLLPSASSLSIYCTPPEELSSSLPRPPQSAKSSLPPVPTLVQPFSFPLLFEYLGLNPQRRLSVDFLSEVEAIIISNNLKYGATSATTLQDFADIWKQYSQNLGLGPNGSSNNELVLVYRLQGQSPPKIKSKKLKTSMDTKAVAETAINISEVEGLTAAEEEERLLALAIAESLKETTEVEIMRNAEAVIDAADSQLQVAKEERDTDTEFQEMSSTGVSDPMGENQLTIEVEEVVFKEEPVLVAGPSKRNRRQSFQSEISSSPVSVAEDERDGFIIGTVKFNYDYERLLSHLSSVMDFWMGNRLPIGVPVEDTFKCNWCEYREGCEWRNEKGREGVRKRAALRKKVQV